MSLRARMKRLEQEIEKRHPSGRIVLLFQGESESLAEVAKRRGIDVDNPALDIYVMSWSDERTMPPSPPVKPKTPDPPQTVEDIDQEISALRQELEADGVTPAKIDELLKADSPELPGEPEPIPAVSAELPSDPPPTPVFSRQEKKKILNPKPIADDFLRKM